MSDNGGVEAVRPDSTRINPAAQVPISESITDGEGRRKMPSAVTACKEEVTFLPFVLILPRIIFFLILPWPPVFVIIDLPRAHTVKRRSGAVLKRPPRTRMRRHVLLSPAPTGLARDFVFAGGSYAARTKYKNTSQALADWFSGKWIMFFLGQMFSFNCSMVFPCSPSKASPTTKALKLSNCILSEISKRPW